MMKKKQEEIASAESNGMIEGTWHRLSDEEREIWAISAKWDAERSSGKLTPWDCPAFPQEANIGLDTAIQGTEADHSFTPVKEANIGLDTAIQGTEADYNFITLAKVNFNKLYEAIRGIIKRDLVVNTEPKQEGLKLKEFLRSTFGSMLDIPPKYHGVLLLLCGGFLSYQAKTMTEPFNHQYGKSTSTPQIVQMNFKEAFFAFFPEMTHITKFILCYSLSWVLVLSLHNGVLICLVLLLISAPLFYFPELVRKASASGIVVACGFVKLPLIWFTSLGAVVISLICALLALVAVYLIWKYINEGKPNDNDIEDGLNLDGLTSVILGV